MKNKLAILVLVAFVAIASMQMSYAEEEYTAFVGCGTGDNETVVDTGSVSATIDSAGDLIISVYNAYPSYEAYVNFTIEHLGSVGEAPRVFLTALGITNAYVGVEMNVVVTDLDGVPIPLYTTYLDPGDTLEGLVTITMLPGAVEGQSYSFAVDLTFMDSLP